MVLISKDSDPHSNPHAHSMNANSVLGNVLSDIIEKYTTHITAIYGIGSYFDDSLPRDWIKNDMDLIVILDDLSIVPKKEWTEVRYERFEVEGNDIFVAYTTIEIYNNRFLYAQFSFANHEWAIMDIKYPGNSKLLFGTDIADQLPDITTFDHEDILTRALYHLEKSYSASHDNYPREASHQFSKSVFKFLFYLSVLYDPEYRKSSIRSAAIKVQEISKELGFKPSLMEIVEQCVKFRRTGFYEDKFKNLRARFTLLVFSMLAKGQLHRPMRYDGLMELLKEGFGDGQEFHYLMLLLRVLKKKKRKKTDKNHNPE